MVELVMRWISKALILICFVSVPVLAADSRSSMPQELYDGMVKFKLNSGDYFDALTMMDDAYIRQYPVDYTTALHGYSLLTEGRKQLDLNNNKKNELLGLERFALGELYYNDGDCINALKNFKGLKSKLSLEDKQRWIFYRANCFIQLGSAQRAAKALRDIVGGLWAAYAYYNLAIEYAEGSHDKTKALGTLWIANSLNKGNSREAEALSDRINLASGLLYLEGGKPDLALDFFRKIHLQTDSSADGLYLNGLAHLELGDFRAATQSWFSTKPYPVIIQSVAEAALAIPYAYDRSGYVSQALEAFLEASSGFEAELRTIDKVDAALKKHGAHAVLIDGSEIKGLEWFLAKGVVKNTTRAAYYSYFVKHNEIHDDIALYAEIKALLASISYWESQLAVFEKALKKKKTDFNQSKNSFSSAAIERKISAYKKQMAKIQKNKFLSPDLSKSLKVNDMSVGIQQLSSRLKSLKKKVSNGQKTLQSQLSESAALKKRLKEQKSSLSAFLKKLDEEITRKCRDRLADLKFQTLANYERSEQGLIHIFQGIAENKNVKRSAKQKGRSAQ